MDANNSAAIRHKLYDYIRVADDKWLNAIYNLLEIDINETNEWWRDKLLVAELDRRFEALAAETDKGFTIDQLEASIDKMRKKRYNLQDEQDLANNQRSS
jgi:hypothetical protein